MGGRDFAGTLEWGEGRGEQGLNPQAPVQVCLCPRRAAIRVHFGVLIMEPLQHFLTNQSQAHQEGLVVKVAPLLSKRVLWGKGDKREGRFKSGWLTLDRAALGPRETHAQLLSMGTEGDSTESSQQQTTASMFRNIVARSPPQIGLAWANIKMCLHSPKASHCAEGGHSNGEIDGEEKFKTRTVILKCAGVFN